VSAPSAAEETTQLFPPVIVLFGAPGSGKGTQARFLAERFHWVHISTGDMLRRHIKAGDEIGKLVQELMKAGKLVTDDLVNSFVEETLAEPSSRAGVILDGYPRTLGQAEVLLKITESLQYRPAVVHLVVDDATIVARLSGRRQCPVCGTLYSNQTHPPKNPGICDNDGTSLIKREDDKESVIRERLEQYELQTRPLLKYLRAAGLPVIETEGANHSPAQILQDICEELLAANVLSPDQARMRTSLSERG
jgi:adenylate kinase